LSRSVKTQKTDHALWSQDKQLRILQVHNFYQFEGGEDSVLANERELLEQSGHTVELYAAYNATISNIFEYTKSFFNATYNDQERARLAKFLAHYSPDIVHVHNFFPLLSPSIYDACIALNIPIVQTLHNYRTFCAAGILLRGGKICELCLDGHAYRSVLYRCYRRSVFGSLAVANMIAYHRRHQTWSTKVTRFIALTSFARTKFIAAGFPPHRIVVKPNFIKDLGRPHAGQREGALFVGRLAHEKGVSLLMDAWADIAIPLRILGDGPERPTLEKRSSQNVFFEGHVGPDRVRAAMRAAKVLIFPSLWYEGLPMSIIEAFANGLPVIASNLESLAELVEDGVTGCLFTPGNRDALVTAVTKLLSYPERIQAMSVAARQRYESIYMPSQNLTQMLEIYNNAISEIRGYGDTAHQT
jgi:glycosyltransferase involved in cell wall biosynthesis